MHVGIYPVRSEPAALTAYRDDPARCTSSPPFTVFCEADWTLCSTVVSIGQLHTAIPPARLFQQIFPLKSKMERPATEGRGRTTSYQEGAAQAVLGVLRQPRRHRRQSICSSTNLFSDLETSVQIIARRNGALYALAFPDVPEKFAGLTKSKPLNA